MHVVPFQGHAHRALQIVPLDIRSQRATPSAVSPDLSPLWVTVLLVDDVTQSKAPLSPASQLAIRD